MQGWNVKHSGESDKELHHPSRKMKPLKTASEIRDAIKSEASGILGWPPGADVMIWPDGRSWKVTFLTVDPERDEQLKFRVEGLAQFMRDRIALAPTPNISGGYANSSDRIDRDK